MTGSIYILKDPRNNSVRYIGQTIVKLSSRYSQHIYQWKRTIGKLTHINSWIKSLNNINLKPVIELIEDNINHENLDNKEVQYIKLYKSIGANLTNHTEGGKGIRGYKQSEESKIKRLNSLKTSLSWKEKHIRHSQIMKDKHKEGLATFGYAHLSSERRIEIGNRHSIKMKEIRKNNPKLLLSIIESRQVSVASLNDDNTINLIFKSVTEASVYYNIQPTHISRVCRGKSKHNMTHGIRFKYYILEQI